MPNGVPHGPYVAVITRLRQAVLPMEWQQLWARLQSDHPPSALLIGTDALDSSAFILLRNAFIKGLLPPTAVRCTGADEDSFARAWAAQKINARLILPRDDIACVVSQMAATPAETHYVLGRLKALYSCDRTAVTAALDALGDAVAR